MTQSPGDLPEREPAPPQSEAIDPSMLQRVWQLGFQQLPLQTETTTFILLNVFDVFMTWTILRFEGLEANPVARAVLDRWGFNGMIFFKMSIVAFVCVVAQVIAHRRLSAARFLLNLGTCIVGAVVLYGILLYVQHLRD